MVETKQTNGGKGTRMGPRPGGHPTGPLMIDAGGVAGGTTAPQTAAPQAQTPPAPAAWPAQAELVMSAIEAGRFAQDRYAGPNRRAYRRRPLRVKAGLRLFSDPPQTPAWTLYTRDVHARGLGFITPHRLPLGYGGLIELPSGDADGGTVTIPCTLLRCREAAPGWFEGSLYFNREQPRFGGE